MKNDLGNFKNNDNERKSSYKFRPRLRFVISEDDWEYMQDIESVFDNYENTIRDVACESSENLIMNKDKRSKFYKINYKVEINQ